MIGWLKEYRRDWLRPDVIAGLTTAAVVIPKAMAYATIAGLPVQVGLYTAFVPMLIYALTGSSRPLSVSTSTTLAILMGAQLSLLVPDGDAVALQRASATLVLMVGVLLVLAAALRLGFVASFISEPVLTGFKAGIGVVIVVDQIPKLLGIHFSKGPFFGNLLSIVKGIPETSAPTLCVALAMIALLFALEHWTPRAPAPLVAVAAGIGGMALLGLSSVGVEAVGHYPAGSAVPHSSRRIPPRSAVARRRRHRADELHRDDRGRTRIRAKRRAGTPAEPRVVRHRPRQCGRRAAGRDGGRRRNDADRGQSPRGGANAGGGNRDGRGLAGHDAVPRARSSP